MSATDTASNTQLIRECLLKRYSGDFHKTVAVREFLEKISLRHMELDLGDRNFVKKLCSDNSSQYWQQLSEVLLGHELLQAGLTLHPSHDGPDFLIEHGRKKIWVEVICPQPSGIPDDWLAAPSGKAVGLPHEAILLRWTSAIKEKAEKLLGNAATGVKGYLEKGVVGAEDIYVVAVNARLLRGPHFASITGISQLPFAVEAAFAVGPITVYIDRNTMKAIGSERQHRPIIKKPNGAGVPAHTFLDPRFNSVSAIWAADIDETWIVGNMKPMAVIHNPNATNPLPVGLLPAWKEYVAIPCSADEYALEERAGHLPEKSVSITN